MLCSADEGVEARVKGRGECKDEGEGALETLVSGDKRFGFVEASYGFARFLVVDKISFLRREGARESPVAEPSFIIPVTGDQS